MKALRIHQPGGPEGFVFEEAPDPKLPTGDVLIEVRGCGFTPNELEWSATWIDRAGRSRTPSIPGHEVSGIVAAVGFGTSGFSVGDEIYGLTDSYRDGAAAEYVSVDARNLARKPGSIDHLQAASLPQTAGPAPTASDGAGPDAAATGSHAAPGSPAPACRPERPDSRRSPTPTTSGERSCVPTVRTRDR